MNDPNGPMLFKGNYHLFWQKGGESEAVWGDIRWGHATSQDLVNWKVLEVALTPGPEEYDKDGCWSGSASLTPNRYFFPSPLVLQFQASKELTQFLFSLQATWVRSPFSIQESHQTPLPCTLGTNPKSSPPLLTPTTHSSNPGENGRETPFSLLLLSQTLLGSETPPLFGKSKMRESTIWVLGQVFQMWGGWCCYTPRKGWI